MTKNLKTLIVVLGPTASGKTDLAIRIAKHFSTEIISADSRQFYKEIPIGTASPESKQLAEINHHFIGHLNINEDYNVSRFEKDVLQLLVQKFQLFDVMIMVGGSGLYIDAVCNGIDELPDPDQKLRNELKDLYKEKGIESLQNKLLKLDPEYFREVDLNNPKRLMRAIEVCIQTGKKYSEQRKNKVSKRDFNIIKIGLEIPREALNKRIGHRTDLMMQNGFLDEARKVHPLKEKNALNTVGYKELFDLIEGKWDQETAVEKIKTNTRRYAKRQMTWFRKDKTINWFSPDEPEKVIRFLDQEIGFN